MTLNALHTCAAMPAEQLTRYKAAMPDCIQVKLKLEDNKLMLMRLRDDPEVDEDTETDVVVASLSLFYQAHYGAVQEIGKVAALKQRIEEFKSRQVAPPPEDLRPTLVAAEERIAALEGEKQALAKQVADLTARQEDLVPEQDMQDMSDLTDETERQLRAELAEVTRQRDQALGEAAKHRALRWAVAQLIREEER